MPAEILQEIRLEFQSIVGKKVAKNVLYSINQIVADAIIKDAYEQDFKGKDLLRYFHAFLALFGWGSADQLDFDPVTGKGVVTIARFPQSTRQQPEPVHDDFCGILARALELSFSNKYEVKETNCCEMGAGQTCTYEIQPWPEGAHILESKVDLQNVAGLDAKTITNPVAFDGFIDHLTMPENGVLMFGEKDDLRRIIVKDVASNNSMTLKIADLIGWKTLGPVHFRVGRTIALKELATMKPLDLPIIKEYLQQLSYFGWGLFELQDMGEGIYHIIVTNNPFTAGFPLQQDATDYLIGGILDGLFESFVGTRVNIKEFECMGKGDKRCLFEVSPPGIKKD